MLQVKPRRGFQAANGTQSLLAQTERWLIGKKCAWAWRLARCCNAAMQAILHVVKILLPWPYPYQTGLRLSDG